MPVPASGQVVVSGTAQAVATSSVGSPTAFVLKAPASNANPVFIGPAGVTSSTGHQLDPGDEITYTSNSQNAAPSLQLRPSDFYVVGTAPDKMTWLASP